MSSFREGIKVILLISFFGISLVHAEETIVSGSVRVEQGIGLMDPKDLVLNREEFSLNAEKTIAECKGKVSGRFRYETKLAQSKNTVAEVREGSVTCRREEWLVSVGRQSVVWGKADGFPVLDVVHPFDYREFIFDDRAASRRPLTMLRVEKRIGNENYAQLLVIPERREDILPKPGDRFSEPLGNQAELADAAGLTNNRDGLHVATPQVGIKWEHASSDISWTLNFLNRWAPQPYYVFNPSSLSVLDVSYQQWIIGGSFDRSFSDWVVRGEMIYMPRDFRSASSSQIDYRSYQQISWMLGVDKSIGEWLLGAQFFQTNFSGAEVEPVGGRQQNTLTLMTTRSFWQDRLQFRGFVARDLNHGGTWLRARNSWQAYSNVELGVQCDWFTGDSDSTLGKLKHESRIKFDIKLDF